MKFTYGHCAMAYSSNDFAEWVQVLGQWAFLRMDGNWLGGIHQLGDYIGHTGDVWSVAISPDGRLLVSGSWDQTVRIWDIESRDNLLTIFNGQNGEWVAWTPTGHYIASPNGEKMIGWQINRGVDKAADYVTAAQLAKQLNRPDIVADTVRLGSTSQALEKAGLSDFSLEQLIKDFLTTD